MLTPQGPEDICLIDNVRRLLAGGLAPSWRDDSGMSFLHLLSIGGNSEGVRYLLESGWPADVYVTLTDEPIFEGITPAHLAAYCGRFECLKALLVDEKVTNSLSGARDTPLHYASDGCKHVAEVLLAMGADVNALDKQGETPFILACGAASVGVMADGKLIELMLARGANPCVRNMHGLTPIHLAAAAGQDNWVIRFMDMGIEVDCRSNFGDTPLHYAARFNHSSVCNTLIEGGAQVNVENGDGDTPLTSALKRRAMDSARALIENGAKGGISTPMAKLPEYFRDFEPVAGVFGGYRAGAALEMVRYLILKGADINAKNDDGITPLHLCFVPGYFRKLGEVLEDFYSDIV